jgi:hypothetical protein
MPPITFTTTLFTPSPDQGFGSGVLLALPKEASAKLPSRGMVMVTGTLNEVPFQTHLEPDGTGSHWFRLHQPLLAAAKTGAGDAVHVAIEPTKVWPEPKVPTILKDVLATDPEALAIWNDITPMARWDWIRWMNAAKQEDTKKKRLNSICSRLRSGKRRPCCFDRAQQTLTEA